MNNLIEKLDNTVKFLKENIEDMPQIAIILGSGLGNLANFIESKKEISYEDIPNFPRTTVVGHEGKLIFGSLRGKKILAMKGRFHYYEGNCMSDVIYPVRVFNRMGIGNLLVTNAAGGVNTGYEPGDLMLITDHIGLFCENPLRGENFDTLGPRFPDMSKAYDRNMQKIALNCAKKLNIDLKQGIYSYCKGPSFETPAEIKALRILGADAVGMSTVPEVIAARHMGMKVLGISCITNMAAGILDQPLNHEEVIETGKKAGKDFSALVSEIIANI
ncbi:MAG: purine-nucleoside phosphorylase [Clostridiaceae bacterium]|nr:purine-nucleoside phosphorylase [Clostridiaceae bacterium]